MKSVTAWDTQDAIAYTEFMTRMQTHLNSHSTQKSQLYAYDFPTDSVMHAYQLRRYDWDRDWQEKRKEKNEKSRKKEKMRLAAKYQRKITTKRGIFGEEEEN